MLPVTPRLTQKPGQAIRLDITAFRAVSTLSFTFLRGARPSNSLTDGKPASTGELRTNSHVNKERNKAATPIPRNTSRHVKAPKRTTKGAAAKIDPTLPSKIVKPLTFPSSLELNHSALDRIMPMKITETPKPTRNRPADAQAKSSANPNTIDPIPETIPPSVTLTLGPNVSATKPAGICIAV